MLSRQVEAVMLERDGGGAPEVSLDGQTRWYRTGTSDNWGRLRQKTGLLVLFGVRRQGYSTYEMRADGLPIWEMSAKEMPAWTLNPKCSQSTAGILRPVMP
jgi:hypothetical protein